MWLEDHKLSALVWTRQIVYVWRDCNIYILFIVRKFNRSQMIRIYVARKVQQNKANKIVKWTLWQRKDHSSMMKHQLKIYVETQPLTGTENIMITILNSMHQCNNSESLKVHNNFFILPWYMNVANTPSLNTGNRTTSWLKHMIRFWRGSTSGPVKSLKRHARQWLPKLI